ncbi:MAG: EthD domain-containing protein [Georgfuchsia sp.]
MGGLKAFVLLARRHDFTPQQFHDYYRHPHGTMGRNLSTLRKYVQSHQINTELLGTDQSRFDAVAEACFDSEKDAMSFRGHPFIIKYIIDDEPRFLDTEKLQILVTEEEVLSSGPTVGAELSEADMMWSPDNRPFSIKLLHFVAPDSDPSWASNQDEALGKRIGALRHVRCRPYRAVHGDTPPYSGVQELWWPTFTAFHTGVSASQDAFAALLGKASGSVTLLAQAERFSCSSTGF